MDNKKREMKTVSVFQRVLEDKRIIRECIQKGGDIKEIARQRGIKFATPFSISERKSDSLNEVTKRAIEDARKGRTIKCDSFEDYLRKVQ